MESHNKTELERRSAHHVKSMIGEILRLLSLHFKGDSTVNQLRIGHYIGLASLYENKLTSNTDIAETLGIPKTTVSRIVADCMDKGWLVEVPDPDDGRRKLLGIDPDHPLADNFEHDFRALLDEALRLFEAGQIGPAGSGDDDR